MKKIILVIALLLALMPNCILFSQTKQDLIGVWDGVEAFDGEYKDKKIEIEFTDSKFSMSYGLRKYKQYDGYILKNNTLTITRANSDIDPHKPQFKIVALNANGMTLKAMNWPAVYITAILTTPYQDIDEETFFHMEDKDLTANGMFNIFLELKRKKEKSSIPGQR